MCFSPKIKAPKIEPRAVEPAPLTQEVTEVEFGGGTMEETEGEFSGRKSLKVEKDKTTSGRMKSSIRKSAFGGGAKR